MVAGTADQAAGTGPDRPGRAVGRVPGRPARRRGAARRDRCRRRLRALGRATSRSPRPSTAWCSGSAPTSRRRSVRFPPVMPWATFERNGYLESFPDQMGSVHTFRGDERAPRRAARAGPRPTQDRGPTARDDRHGALPGGVPPALPDHAGRAARRRPAGRGLRLLLPPRTEHRPVPDAGVPPARLRLPRHPGRRPRPPRPVDRPGSRHAVGTRPRRRSRSSPTTRSSAGPAGCWRPTSATRSSSSRLVTPVFAVGAADGHLLVQLPPRPLRPPLRHRDARRRGRPTPRASASAWTGSPSPCSTGTGSTRTRWPAGGPRPALAVTAADADRPLARSLLPARRRRLPPAPAARRRADLDRDQLLRRRLDRGAPRPRSRPAGRGGVHPERGLRGRPVDLLQVPARGPPQRCSDSRSPSSTSGGRCVDHVVEQLGLGPAVHGRGRLVVPARHPGRLLPRGPREDHHRAPDASTSRGGGSATSTTPATSSSTGTTSTACSGSGATPIPPSFRPTSRSSGSTGSAATTPSWSGARSRSPATTWPAGRADNPIAAMGARIRRRPAVAGRPRTSRPSTSTRSGPAGSAGPAPSWPRPSSTG